MYPKPRTSNYSKQNPQMRWALPDRVFFACGACHILAYAFLEKYRPQNTKILWIKPDEGFSGNHIFLSNGEHTFDYHGCAHHDAFISRTFKKAQFYWPNWNAKLIELPKEVLISTPKSKTYDGLWLREPQDFLHNALPRAYNYLEKISQRILN